MKDDLAPKGTPHPQAATNETNPQTLYIAEASLREILVEQLEYLATHHAANACPAGCVDCARYSQVENWLLLPFRPSAFSETAILERHFES